MEPMAIGPVLIERLWPDAAMCQDPTISDNDKSLVIRISCGDRAVLICSDIEAFAQTELLQRPDNLKADVLIMPHHGSQTHLNEQFIRAVDPSVIVVSCSRTRQASAYRPPPTIHAFYTPTDGAVTIRIEPDGAVTVHGYHSAREVRMCPD
jgi:beta-lactamase superfamily II metal-dependent hydrolase